MDQMTPYCFKCGAELEPETIYCPVCGRLQRSMVVRATPPGPREAPDAPPAGPPPGQPGDEPISFYPSREPAAADHLPEPGPPPDPPAPHAAPPPDEPLQVAEGVDHIYAQRPDAEPQYEAYDQQGYQAYDEQAYDHQGHAPQQGYDQSYAHAGYEQGPVAADPYGGYGSPAPPIYAPEPPRSRGNLARLIAIGAAAALGLFLIGFTITHMLVAGSGSQAGPTAPPHRGGQVANTGTTPGGSTPAPTPTTDQGGGAASWQRVSSDVTGTCSTKQGCPVAATLRNTGGRGGGTVTITLTDSGGNPIATYSGPVPVTASGDTAQVSGYANGDQLGPYLRGGGIVYLKSVDVTNG